MENEEKTVNETIVEENNNEIYTLNDLEEKERMERLEKKETLYSKLNTVGFSIGMITMLGYVIYILYFLKHDKIIQYVERARIGTIINGECIYQDEDINNIHYVKVEDADGNITTHMVKECNVDDYFSYEKSTGGIRYGEHYIGKDYKNLFGDNKGHLDAKIYIDILDDSVVSVATSSLYSDAESLVATLYDNSSNNKGYNEIYKSLIEFKYAKILEAESLPDCLAFLESRTIIFTTGDFEKMKEQLDNQQTINQKGAQKIK